MPSIKQRPGAAQEQKRSSLLLGLVKKGKDFDSGHMQRPRLHGSEGITATGGHIESGKQIAHGKAPSRFLLFSNETKYTQVFNMTCTSKKTDNHTMPRGRGYILPRW